MTDRELMQQALDALVRYAPQHGNPDDMDAAIKTLRARLAQPEPELKLKSVPARWCPDVCPITGSPFFMWIEHHKTGQMVPTYGGPYDSYTIPERDADGSYFRERYDHDEGGWLLDCVEDVGIQIVSDQAYVYEDEPPCKAGSQCVGNKCDRYGEIDPAEVHTCSPQIAQPEPEPSQGNWIAAEDVLRNVKALDVALNGEGGAERPLLIDVLAQVQGEARRLGMPVLKALAQPEPKWKDLTSDELVAAVQSVAPIVNAKDIPVGLMRIATAVERALKDKNNG